MTQAFTIMSAITYPRTPIMNTLAMFQREDGTVVNGDDGVPVVMTLDSAQRWLAA